MTQQNNYVPTDIIRLAVVMRMSGLSKSSVYRLSKLGQFPRAVRLSVGCVGWRYGDVQQWLDDRAVA